MNFLLDQDVYAITARHLREQGHDVVTASDLGQSRATDEELLSLAHQQDRLFVTRDRDFGGLVFVRNFGLIRSELLSLKWGNVNFEHRLVTVEAGYSKNGEARSVPMSLRLTQTLEPIRIGDPNAPVFLNSEGKPYRDVKTAFNSAVRRAGIQDFTFHDLRHTFASRLVMSGVDLTTVKELMGHKHINMTLRYAHLSPGHKRSAIAVFDEVPTSPTTCSDLENVHPPK